ncbi:MAG: antitoxin VapB family protein [Promethearchaeota archaeon]
MTFKLISVKEKIYKQLEQLKNPSESVLDLLERLIQNHKKDPLKHFGIARQIPVEILDDFEKAVLGPFK